MKSIWFGELSLSGLWEFIGSLLYFWVAWWKIPASDVRSQRWIAGIFCGLNVKQEPHAVLFILALLGRIWHTVTNKKVGEVKPVYWLQSLTPVCLCVWWNCILRDNTFTGLFSGKIASLLSDNSIMCLAVFRLVLFSKGSFFPTVPPPSL